MISKATKKYGALVLLGALVSVLVGYTPPAHAADFSLTPSVTSINYGQTMTISWTAPDDQVTTSDYIALSLIGAPENNNYRWWQFTGGATSGTLTLTVLAPVGTLEFRYYGKFYSRKATSVPIEITSPNATPTPTPGDTPTPTPTPGGTPTPTPTPSLYTVTSSTSAVNAGQSISVSWDAPAGEVTVNDYVAISLTNGPDSYLNNFRWWQHTGGEPSGTLTFTALSPGGTYEFRYYRNNSYVRMATSGTVIITDPNGTPTPTPTSTPPPTPTPTPGDTPAPTPTPGSGSGFTVETSATSINVLQTLLVSWNAPDGETAANDWVGLSLTTGPDSGLNSYRWWKYTGGETSGIFSLSAPTPGGTYEFRYYTKGGYTRKATSLPIVITNPNGTPTPTPTPTPATCTTNCITVVGIPALDATPIPRIPQPGGSFFVSPSGSSFGNGTAANPWDLQTALSHPSTVKAGDTIWLLAGTYEGGFSSYLSGTSAAPILVRNWPGDRVIIKGTATNPSSSILTVYGADTWYWGFEVTSDPFKRVYTDGQLAPATNVGVTVYGPRTKFINLIVHDVNGGYGFWDPAVDAEVYGSVVYNNGTADILRGHGHGLYIQNTEGIKRITDVISLNNAATGMKAYGTNVGIQGVHFDGIIAANNGTLGVFPGNPSNDEPFWRLANILFGTVHLGVDDLSVTNSYLYHGPRTTVDSSNLLAGYQGTKGGSITIRNNYIAGSQSPFDLEQFDQGTVAGNTFFGDFQGGSGVYSRILQARPGLPATFAWNNNAYFDATSIALNFYFPPANYTFSGWKAATGFDSTSTYATGKPTGVKIFVRPNLYVSGRANIAVYNWTSNPTVNVNLAGIGLQSGQQYEIRNAFDYIGAPVRTATYSPSSSTVAINMSSLGVAQPIGMNITLPNTAPQFAALVVVPIETPGDLSIFLDPSFPIPTPDPLFGTPEPISSPLGIPPALAEEIQKALEEQQAEQPAPPTEIAPAEPQPITGTVFVPVGAKVAVFGKDPRVYILKGNTYRPLTDDITLSSPGIDPSQVVRLTAAAKSRYRRVKLMKTADSPRVYYITEAGLKRHVPNVTVFNSYKDKWRDVMLVEPAELASIPDNTLVKLPNTFEVYFLDGDTIHHISSPEVFNQRGFQWNRIAPINATEFGSYIQGEPI